MFSRRSRVLYIILLHPIHVQKGASNILSGNNQNYRARFVEKRKTAP